ncbi:MAG TPA: metallophosphoesterase, partial [Anaerolineae bacterium]|nr:metallophosphoesterase [Anaerolineae bacterium]
MSRIFHRALLLTVVLSIALISPVLAQPPTAQVQRPASAVRAGDLSPAYTDPQVGQPAVAHVPALAPSQVVTITVLHTNDFHGNLELAGSNPGMARVADVINDVRASVGASNVVLLDAGDMMQGTLLSNLFQGESTIDVYKALGYNAVTFGNHEFDWGQTVLISRTVQAATPEPDRGTFSFVSANIVVNDTGSCDTAGWTSPSFARPWITMTVGAPGNQAVLGIVGVTSQETPYITIAAATQGLCFKDPAESIIHYYDAIETAGADAIVVLSHIGNTDGGYGYGFTVYGDQTLARKLVDAGKPVPLIIGGHSHTDLAAAQVISGTTVVQAHYAGRKVGQATLVIDEATGAVNVSWQRLVVSTSGDEDATIKAVIDTWASDSWYQEQISRVVGYTNVDLVRDYNGDSLMGKFVNDAIYEDLNNDAQPLNDVDMVFNNAGGLRADILTGGVTPYTLTHGLLYNVLPFGNQTI